MTKTMVISIFVALAVTGGILLLKNRKKMSGLLSDIELGNVKTWPVLLKKIVIAEVCVIAFAVMWVNVINPAYDDLERMQKKEVRLKQDLEQKQRKAVNLGLYKNQQDTMYRMFGALLRQLPSRFETDAMYIDVSQVALMHAVQINEIKPGKERHVEFYAELPVIMKITGNYTDIGNFISGLYDLPRVMNITDFTIRRANQVSNKLEMELAFNIYRYLDESEFKVKRKKKRKRRY